MGQLTNQFVSQSYQGILNLENPNTGFTANLQTITDGLGGSSPLQISQTQVNISGTFTVNGSPVSVDTGSLVTTSSFNAYTSSVDLRFDGIEAKTGSYATTGSNVFEGNQTINGDINITGSLSASGLNYPIVDNGAKSFIQTDGAGNLTLEYVESMLEPIRNGEATTLTKGTPVYVSGSQGANPIVFRADAADPNKMPVIYIVNEDLQTNQVGVGILLGKIEGVNTTGYPAGTEIFVAAGGGWTSTRPTGSAIIQSLGIVTKEGNGGQGIVLNPGPSNLPNLPNNNLWLGDSNSYPQATPLSSLGLATTGSLSGYTTVTDFNNFTSSIDSRVDSLEIETGSLQNQINQKLDTGSFNTYTSSIDTKLAGIDIETGSLQNQINGLATTGSLSGYTTVTTFNNYTSSNDTKVNDLISKTGSYATTGSNTFNGNQNILGTLQVRDDAAFSSSILVDRITNADNAILTIEPYTQLILGNSVTTSSLYGQLELNNSKVVVNTGDIIGATNEINLNTAGVTITGSVNIDGTITAESASFTYLKTIYETSSVIFSSGSNILGDEAGDVQTLYGTVKLPNGPLDVTGSVIATNFTGSLQGTASYATQALSASYAPDTTNTGSLVADVQSGLASDQIVVTKGDGSSTSFTINNVGFATSSSFAQNALSASYAPDTTNTGSLVTDVGLGLGNNIVNVTKGDGSVTSFTINDVTNATSASYATNALSSSHSEYSENSGLLNGTGSGVFATTGSNTFLGDQTITGSVNVSGSVNVVGPTSLNTLIPNDYKQNLVILAGKNQVTSSTVFNNYINAITTSLNNSDVNFGMIPGVALIGGGIQNQTGSVFISGSNNFIMNLGSGIPASQGRRQVLGNANFVQSATPTINTSSLTIPQINNNYFGSSVTFTLTTGSNLGNNAHALNTNILLGSGININHPSASIGAGTSTQIQSNINVGVINSNASGSVLTAATTFNNNINAHPALTLNHISSSIQSTNNIFFGGGAITVANRFFTTGSNNILTVSANLLGGQATTINASGQPATNTSRGLVGNLIGGQGVVASLEQTNTDLAGLRNSLVFGYNLVVSGSHSAGNTTQQGTAIVGRWNGQDNGLADSARTVFSVGTGTGAANRRTSLYVTSGSLVGVSGSMYVNGDTIMSSSSTVPLIVSGTINSQRLHFDSNPFNTDPSSNLGAIRMAGDNQTFQYTNYDRAQITTQSFIDQYVNTGSLTTQTRLGARYNGTEVKIETINNNGSRRVDILTDSMTVTGSMNISYVMNMRPLDPLPAGNIGDLAVSSSNQLYFYNGAWTLVV